MFHDLYMGDKRQSYPDDQFDTNLRTGEVVANIAQSVIDGEKNGDELVIIVRTYNKRRKV